MESVWIALIVAGVTGTISPALLLWMKNKSDRQQRLDDIAARRAERLEDQAREDAKEARALEKLETIKKQTDGVVAQVTALAKATGRIEGGVEATKAAEGTAATLLLGQQQGRDAERESVTSKLKSESDRPLPVADERTAAASERVANASEVLANATQRVADAAETKKE